MYTENRFIPLTRLWHSRFDSEIVLTQEDLLAISQQISHDHPLSIETARPELVIVSVDPYHLYAYWNLGKNLITYWQTGDVNKEVIDDPLDNELTLRVYAQPEYGRDLNKTSFWFDVPVQSSVTQQQVRIPSHETAYCAAIGKRYSDDRFVVFASSNIINVPQDRSSPIQRRQQDRAMKNQGKITKTGLTGDPAKPGDFLYAAAEGMEQKRNMNKSHPAAILHTHELNPFFNPETNKGKEVTRKTGQQEDGESPASNTPSAFFDHVLIEQAGNETENNTPLHHHTTENISSQQQNEYFAKTASGQGKN